MTWNTCYNVNGGLCVKEDVEDILDEQMDTLVFIRRDYMRQYHFESSVYLFENLGKSVTGF